MNNSKIAETPKHVIEETSRLLSTIQGGSYVQIMKQLFYEAPNSVPAKLRDNLGDNAPHIAHMVRVESETAHLKKAIQTDAMYAINNIIDNARGSLNLLNTRSKLDSYTLFSNQLATYNGTKENLFTERETLTRLINEYIDKKNKIHAEIIQAMLSNHTTDVTQKLDLLSQVENEQINLKNKSSALRKNE